MKISAIWQNLTKANNLKQEPINKVSLFVLILIDLFVLWNVFAGLNSVQNIVLKPMDAHPCYTVWQTYRQSQNSDKKYQFLRKFIDNSEYSNRSGFDSVRGFDYSSYSSGKLFGKIDPTCLEFQKMSSKIDSEPNLKTILQEIKNLESSNNSLNSTNTRLQKEYDSTLLEKIAAQNSQNSINLSTAEKTKQNLDQNQSQINQNQNRINLLQNEIITNQNSQNLLTFVDNNETFQGLEKNYNSAKFIYPLQNFGLQIAFLLPLIFLALFFHWLSNKKNWGLLAILSWHLFLIFCIPAVFRLFEFLQFGSIAQWFLEVLFSSLAFLGSYLLIFLIPLIGYLFILFFQKIVFNKKSQFKKRLAGKECFDCGYKLNNGEFYCPNCGICQFKECHNCHKPRYQNMEFCQHCGTKKLDLIIENQKSQTSEVKTSDQKS